MITAADEAERMVAEVRDDPAGRIRCAADAYAFGRGGRRYRPYRRAVAAFMRWQQARGVLNALDDDRPGSPWWRAVNEDLLRDTVEAKLIIERGEGQPSRPNVARWVNFFNAPSARSWYEAHNASVVAGYLAHATLAALEAPAERFFMNVVLVRVLYAHALVLDGDLALGRLSFLARLIGHPRSRGPQTLLSMKDVLPDRYPIRGLEIEELINTENRLGRMMDYGVIGVRVDALYAASAQALGEPRLLELAVDGAPAYAWPADQRHVWKPQSQGKFTSLIEFLTRPSPADASQATVASRSISSVAACSPERTAPSVNPYMTAEVPFRPSDTNSSSNRQSQMRRHMRVSNPTYEGLESWSRNFVAGPQRWAAMPGLHPVPRYGFNLGI